MWRGMLLSRRGVRPVIPDARRLLQRAGYTVSRFGSRARADNVPLSDLDLLIEGDLGRSQNGPIAEELEESTLLIRVDLVLD